MPDETVIIDGQTVPDAALNAPGRIAGKSRAELLAEVAGLPPEAFVSPKLAAAYIDTTPSVMASWRQQRRGPRFHGRREFVRYRICDLDLFMADRADEVNAQEKLDALKAG